MCPFVLEDETHCVRGLIVELLSDSEKLTDWEKSFLTSLTNWKGNFTIKQSRAAVLMHAKHFPDRYTEP